MLLGFESSFICTWKMVASDLGELHILYFV